MSSKCRERAYLHATLTAHYSHNTKLWFDGRSSEIYSSTPEVSDTGIDVHPVRFNSTLSNSWLKTCVAVPRTLPTQYFSMIICRQMQGTGIPSHRSCIQPFIYRHRCLVSTGLPLKDGSVSWIPLHCILPDYSLFNAPTNDGMGSVFIHSWLKNRHLPVAKPQSIRDNSFTMHLMISSWRQQKFLSGGCMYTLTRYHSSMPIIVISRHCSNHSVAIFDIQYLDSTNVNLDQLQSNPCSMLRCANYS